jgi:hypothetical protein
MEEDIKQHCEELKSLLEQVEDPSKKLTLADLASGNLIIFERGLSDDCPGELRSAGIPQPLAAQLVL